MKKWVALLLSGYVVSVSADSRRMEWVVESRQLVKEYGGRLKNALQGSLKVLGAEAAIERCNSMVPDINRDMNESGVWQVGRTSLKIRNLQNAPDNWELQVLQQFQHRKQLGENVEALEYHEIVVQDDGQRYFRYMKAIPMQPVCLTCHGETVNGPLADKVLGLYPQDQATGFKLGDIRGAFTVSRQID